jgi:SAM-dependent methyltransferase
MSAVRPYYAPGSMSAAFYDVVTAADARLAGDVEVYAGLAPAAGSVLELGTGSGRIAAALAARGLAITGVDIARPMLAQAEQRRAGLPPQAAARIEFRLGDMTSLDLKRLFDLAICPYFTLAHAPAGQAWRNTFATAARHLPAGGLAAFHLPRLELMRQAGPPEPAAVVLDESLPTGGRLRLRVLDRRFRPDIGRLAQVIEYEELDPRGASLRRSPERLVYFMADPVPLAASAGLAPDRDPIPLGGVGDIWVFRRDAVGR